MNRFLCLVFLVIGLLPSVAFGQQWEGQEQLEAVFGFQEAAAIYQVPAAVLQAISWVESRHHVHAVNTENYNDSEDHGHMQINSFWKDKLPKGGWEQIQRDPKYCTAVGAWILRYYIDRFGNNWNAVCAYHTGRPLDWLYQRALTGEQKYVERYERGANYVRKVYNAMVRFGTIEGPPLVVAENAGPDERPLKR